MIRAIVPLIIAMAALGCTPRDLLNPGPPPGVIQAGDAIEPLEAVRVELLETPQPVLAGDPGGDPDGKIREITTGLSVGFVNWDDNLDPDGLELSVRGQDSHGRPAAIGQGRLILTLFTDPGDRLDRRGKPVCQWVLTEDQPKAGWRELKLSIEGKKIAGGYYTLETRLVTPGAVFIHIDPALKLSWPGQP